MKDPRNLSKKDLAEIVTRVRNWLWMTEEDKDMVIARYGKLGKKIVEERQKLGECCHISFFDPDVEWESCDILSGIADVMFDFGLRPKSVCPISEAYNYDRWADDEVQFARLLEELQGIGIFGLLKEAEWASLEDSMDLKREQIMKIWDRAQKRWDKAKADLKKEQKK